MFWEKMCLKISYIFIMFKKSFNFTMKSDQKPQLIHPISFDFRIKTSNIAKNVIKIVVFLKWTRVYYRKRDSLQANENTFFKWLLYCWNCTKDYKLHGYEIVIKN